MAANSVSSIGFAMTTADYALILSLFSLLTAMAALVWNAWQKFIFVRPSLQVSFSVVVIMEHGAPGFIRPNQQTRLLSLGVTNMGPGPIVLHSCVAKMAWNWRRPWLRAPMGLLNPIHGDPTDPNPRSIGPFSAGLPTKIEPGDSKSFYFPYREDCFLTESPVLVGVNDTYSRIAWCRRKDVRKAMRSFQRDFPRRTQ